MLSKVNERIHNTGSTTPHSPRNSVALNGHQSAGTNLPSSVHFLHSIDLCVPRRADTETRLGFPPESDTGSSGISTRPNSPNNTPPSLHTPKEGLASPRSLHSVPPLRLGSHRRTSTEMRAGLPLEAGDSISVNVLLQASSETSGLLSRRTFKRVKRFGGYSFNPTSAFT